MSDALPGSVIEALARSEAYRDDPSARDGVEWVQTHLSHVFLTRERVYKLRKPVDLDFVSFRTRAQRNADCLREVVLNRRLAPDVYLGVAPVEWDSAGTWIGRVAEGLATDTAAELEHCVVMRRLPAGRDALSLLGRDALSRPQLTRLALRVAAFHDRHGLGVPAPFDSQAWQRVCTGPAEESLALLRAEPAERVPPELVERVSEAARRVAAECGPRFEQRRQAGRAVDAHGDLHLQHVWFETDGAEPLAIDCLEFNERLRHIDAAAEVAFTAMDLAYRGRRDLAEYFLGVYAAARDDFALYAVVDYFESYRAVVRAKVAALAARDAGIEAVQRARAVESVRHHLELAAGLLEPSDPGALVLVGGIVGSGKSSAARALAERHAAPVVASDRVRRSLPGLPAAESRGADVDAGLYAPQLRERVYAALFERAEPVLASGRPVILDATWSRREHRATAGRLAERLGTRLLFVEMRCGEQETLRRLAQREAAGHDASDAGPAFYTTSAARFEAWSARETGQHRVLRSTAAAWEKQLDPVLAWLGDSPARAASSPAG